MSDTGTPEFNAAKLPLAAPFISGYANVVGEPAGRVRGPWPGETAKWRGVVARSRLHHGASRG